MSVVLSLKGWTSFFMFRTGLSDAIQRHKRWGTPNSRWWFSTRAVCNRSTVINTAANNKASLVSLYSRGIKQKGGQCVRHQRSRVRRRFRGIQVSNCQLRANLFPWKEVMSLVSIKKMSVMKIKLTKGKKKLSLTWASLSYPELISRIWQKPASYLSRRWLDEGSFARSCPNQLHTRRRGTMSRLWILVAASGEEVCHLFSTEILVRGAWIIAQNPETHPAGRAVFSSHCISYFCATLSRDLKCNGGSFNRKPGKSKRVAVTLSRVYVLHWPYLNKNEAPVA